MTALVIFSFWGQYGPDSLFGVVPLIAGWIAFLVKLRDDQELTDND